MGILIVKRTTEDLTGLTYGEMFLSDWPEEVLSQVDVYLGYEDDALLSHMIIRPALGVLDLYFAPYVCWFRNDGSPDLKQAMLEKIKEVTDGQFLACNASDYPDELWTESFSAAGVFTKIGTLFIANGN